MDSKGQSGIEYLSVYAIAFMILLVVLAAVWYVFYSKPTITPHCDLYTDFLCTDYYIHEDGNLTLRIKQTTGHPINVTGFNCTKEENAAMVLRPVNPPLQINNGEEALIANETPCYRIAGTTASGSIGEYYGGNIFINYTEADTGMNHMLKGGIVVRYE